MKIIKDKIEIIELKELCRLRDVLADYFYFDNIYGSTDQNMRNYFFAFNHAATLEQN